MKEHKVTPGRWEVRGHGPYTVWGASDTNPARSVSNPLTGPILNSANAHLMAAAPDLLAACEEALAQINLGIHVAWDPGISDHLRAAVAKAGRP